MKRPNLKHLKHQIKNKQYLTHKINLAEQKGPKKTKLANPFKLFKYYPNLSTKTIQQNYQNIIPQLIDRVIKTDIPMNEKDNRTLLNELNYFTEPDDPKRYWFNGIVIDHKVVVVNHHVNVFLLVGFVNAVIKQSYQKAHQNKRPFTLRPCTDHVWLEITNSTGMFTNSHDVTIGLGDMINFSGHIYSYRGRREHITQTKYGINDVQILNAGYPKIKIKADHQAQQFATLGVDFVKPIVYPHFGHYLIRFYDHEKFYQPFIQFGDQIDAQANKLLDNPVYRFGQYDQDVRIRYIFEYGKHLTTPKTLIYNDHELNWVENPTKNDTIVGSSTELKAVGFYQFYKAACDKYHWRYITQPPQTKTKSKPKGK